MDALCRSFGQYEEDEDDVIIIPKDAQSRCFICLEDLVDCQDLITIKVVTIASSESLSTDPLTGLFSRVLSGVSVLLHRIQIERCGLHLPPRHAPQPRGREGENSISLHSSRVTIRPFESRTSTPTESHALPWAALTSC